MNLPPLAMVGLVGNAITLTISLAIMLLSLWQGRRRINLVMVAFMAAVAANSLALIAFRIPELFTPPLIFWTQVAASATATYGILLFAFTTLFTGRLAAWVRVATIVGGGLWAAAMLAIWTGSVIASAAVDAAGFTNVRFTPVGIAMTVALVSYIVLAQAEVLGAEDRRSRLLVAPLLVFVLGTLSNVVPPFSRLPVYSVLTTIGVYMLGHVFVTEQLLNPLVDLNTELEQKNKELERASELKSQFIATMSHELRTPLNSIIGFTSLMLEGIYGPLNPQQEKRLTRVSENANALLHLIDDVLDFSRLQAGHLPLHSERIDLTDLVREAVSHYRHHAVDRGLTLHTDIPEGLPAIFADRKRIVQVLDNLLSNAIKFTKRGSIMVEARVESDRRFVRISVTDTGVGIPPDLLDEIFEDFRQADSTVTREFEGTGLGLAICRRLVDMHGGRIEVSSQVGIGSTFTIVLPVVADEDAAQTAVGD